nr:hypothetical protein [Tanacetum cinerariifolium]
MIVVGANNRPPMLDKSMYNSWQSRMLLYVKGKKNSRMMLKSIKNGPLVYPTIEENGQIREKKYAELTEQEQLQDDSSPGAYKVLKRSSPEWSKFVTDVKLAKNLYTTNYDQLFAYLSQHNGMQMKHDCCVKDIHILLHWLLTGNGYSRNGQKPGEKRQN